MIDGALAQKHAGVNARPLEGTVIKTLTDTRLKTVSAEEFDKAVLAVRFVVLLFERAFVQLFKAEGADKMLRVKLLAHGGDTAAGYRLLTAGAERAASLVIMCLAVRLPLVLEETAIHERNETLPAHETLGVPQRVQGRDVVVQDGSGTAATFWGKYVKVIFPAVCFALLLMETLRAKE